MKISCQLTFLIERKFHCFFFGKDKAFCWENISSFQSTFVKSRSKGFLYLKLENALRAASRISSVAHGKNKRLIDG
ncbi:hypothetical protein EUGRSUZ_C00219 [Eucalyptus grandis]|uniref:Uncharacterized protein n=2 Tax=Eucalyptus grandis TaxID=71139 RepID=A0ACC3L8Z3_EUCGR|nr:hypothetical protein EUGRSUZ_C00219 [Eucalyptus grandis]